MIFDYLPPSFVFVILQFRGGSEVITLLYNYVIFYLIEYYNICAYGLPPLRSSFKDFNFVRVATSVAAIAYDRKLSCEALILVLTGNCHYLQRNTEELFS